MPTKNATGALFGFLTLIFGFVSVASLLLGGKLAFWICLLFSLTTLVIFTVLRFADLVNFFLSRQARYGANVALSIVGVIGIAAFMNAIVAQRFDKRADLTTLQLYTISEQTKTVLKSLEENIEVIAFFSRNGAQNAQAATRAEEMLELYARETQFLTVSFKNPFIDIQLRDMYDIQRDGTIIFKTEKRREKVTTVGEQKFTSAILKLIRNETRKIHFLVEHEEHGLGDFNKNGYSEVKTELENQNYAAFPLSLLTEPDIPADCEVLVIAGPRTALAHHELDAIEKYLTRSGKLFLLLDPSVTSAQDVNGGLVQLMKKWGVTIGNDLVLDHVRHAIWYGGPIALLPEPQPHDITLAVQDGVTFLLTRSITPIVDRPVNLSVRPLLLTVGGMGGSWGETQRETDGTFNPDFTTFTYNPSMDTPPPVSVAVAIERKTDTDGNGDTTQDPTRIVVFGDSDFAANAIFRAPNRDLFLAAINWLTLEEDLVAIRPIDLRQQALREMTIQDVRVVQITAVFFIPLIVFIAGVTVWWQRRKGEDA